MNRLPDSSYKTKYPWNAATVTRCGHIMEVDDTPCHERLRIAHKSGTYCEVSADGKKVEYVVGHNHQYNKGGYTLTVDENGDIGVNGHLRLNAKGGAHIEIGGEGSIIAGGGLNLVVIGDLKAAVSGDMNLKTNGTTNINSNGDTNVETTGATNVKSGSDVTVTAASLQVNGPLNVKGDISTSGIVTSSGIHFAADFIVGGSYNGK